MVAELCTIHPNDKRYRLVNYDKLERSTTTVPLYREQLELEIKDTFLWAIGQSALTEMTKMVRERKPVLYRFINYTLFPTTFHPRKECTTQPS